MVVSAVDRMATVERMVHVSEVAWGQHRPGSSLVDVGHPYWVMWKEDGVTYARDFRTARAAEQFANHLDTSGRQQSVRDIREAERSLRGLEKAMREFEAETPEERRIRVRAIGELERAVRPVRVRQHRRQR